MDNTEIQKLRSLTSFEKLVDYLRDELDWPIEAEDAEDITFDYDPQELGIDPQHAVKIETIKQIRPLTDNQPWGIFYIQFESKRLPVVVLRRILRALIPAGRGRDPDRPVWRMSDLMFISSQGEPHKRSISFAHFHHSPLPEGEGDATRLREGVRVELRTFSWDSRETHFYYIKNLNLEALRWPRDERDTEGWRAQWGRAFVVPHRYVPKTAQSLAQEMAKLARTIRETVLDVYGLEHSGGPLHQLHLSFKMTLINDLTADDFADMYAQTITYGLFSARATRHGDAPIGGGFAVEDVAAMIPSTNPFLRELLEELVTQEAVDLDELGVEQLAAMLKEVNIEAILQDFGRQRRGEDPVIHFYETFLHAYDAEKKAQRGVFYTPTPVVSFIVRSVDHILREEFGYADGLADTGTMDWHGEQVPRVQILDPAAGTGTFLEYVIEQVYRTFVEKHRKKGQAEVRRLWNEYVPKHLLPRLHGFELMMAPYTVAHMKLGLKLKQTGYDFGGDERLRVYLTNSLQPSHEVPRLDTPALAHEAEQANDVKMNAPVTIVIGNPPYANYGMMNKGEWILGLLEDYKKGLNEKKINLDDDFIKFLRFAQWRIDQTGIGILAFITNNTFIEGITHRRMRQSLMETFDMIYILDLHGSSKKKEKAPDGSVDENVFDIQQGVSIVIFVRGKITKKKIVFSELWGSRSNKYENLLIKNLDSIIWEELAKVSYQSCLGTFYLFTKKAFENIDEYCVGWSLKDIFLVFQNGVKTDRDNLFLDFDRDILSQRIQTFYSKVGLTPEFRKLYGVEDSSSYQLLQRRNSTAFDEKNIHYFLYRPFNFRWIYYSPNLTSRPAWEVMQHVVSKPNLGIITTRQSTGKWDLLVTRNICGHKSCAAYDINSLFPIYTYPEDQYNSQGQYNIFAIARGEGIGGSRPNFSQKFINHLASYIQFKFVPDGTGDLQETCGPEDIFHYMYGVFNSPTYCERYAEFLEIDYPRLPLTSNLDLFRALCHLGADLVALHLMEDDYPAASWNVGRNSISPLQHPITTFVQGANGTTMGAFSKSKVYAVHPERLPMEASRRGRVYLDTSLGEASSFFDGVPEDVWNFHIGGYQVLYKWLYDRRGSKGQPGRTLTPEDLAHYQRIVVALKETMRLMEEIDEVIEAHGGWPIQ